MATIFNASSRPLNLSPQGSVPDVSGAMLDWFQPTTFDKVIKTTVGFQVVETTTPVEFWGVVQPLSGRQLMLKPEGQRAWTWLLVHSQIALPLNVDDVVLYKGVQTRIMSQKDYSTYGYYEYQIVQDWTGSGP